MSSNVYYFYLPMHYITVTENVYHNSDLLW